MATIKSYTDLEQSKKLAEILPLESADMVYVHTVDLEGDEHYDIDFRNNQPLFEDDISAWSLAELLGVLPEGTRLLKSTNISSIGDTKYHCDCPKGNINVWFDNPIDACYEMILKLNELKVL